MEITQFEGDIFWNEADTETACEPDDELDNASEVGAIVEFEQAKRLTNFFGVLLEKECKYFTTLEEAEECSAGLKSAKNEAGQ
jgi:hypothetical protein